MNSVTLNRYINDLNSPTSKSRSKIDLDCIVAINFAFAVPVLDLKLELYDKKIEEKGPMFT